MQNNDHHHPRKLTFGNILFLCLLGLLIVLFKFYFVRGGDLCHETCSYINSELDVIRCLDACAVNAEDFREPVTFKKIISIIIIIVILSFILYRFINNSIIRGNGNNIILQIIQRIKHLKNRLLYKYKYDYYGYKKLDD